MDNEKKVVFLMMVIERRLKDEILSALRDSNINVINVMYGKGALKGSAVMNMFGLVVEENKLVITSVTTSQKADIVLDLLENKFNFDKPNTGIGFTIPVECVSY